MPVLLLWLMSVMDDDYGAKIRKKPKNPATARM